MSVNFSRISRKTRRLFIEYEKKRDNKEGQQIFDEIVQLNLPVVHFVARKFYGFKDVPKDDIYQVGCIGLIKAVERFDISRGFQFSTFASATIEGEIRRYFRDNRSIVKFPRQLVEIVPKIHQTVDRLAILTGKEPTIEDISRELGVLPDVIVKALSLPKEVISLDSPIGGNEGSSSIIETLCFDDDSFDNVENQELLKVTFEALNDEEKKIIGLRFWFNMTQTEIARELGISQMQVSRMIRMSLSKMQKHFSIKDFNRGKKSSGKVSLRVSNSSPSLSSLGVSIFTESRNVVNYDINELLHKFSLVGAEEDFEMDCIFYFATENGIKMPRSVFEQVIKNFIHPSRKPNLFRLKPDESLVSSDDVILLLISNLESITENRGVLT